MAIIDKDLYKPLFFSQTEATLESLKKERLRQWAKHPLRKTARPSVTLINVGY